MASRKSRAPTWVAPKPFDESRYERVILELEMQINNGRRLSSES